MVKEEEMVCQSSDEHSAPPPRPQETDVKDAKAAMAMMGLPTAFAGKWEGKEEDMDTEVELWCDVCDLGLNSRDTYASHVRGQKHMKKLQMFSVQRGLAVELPQAKTRVKVPVRLQEKVVESNEPVVGLAYVREVIAMADQEMEPHYQCSLCRQQGQANCMLLHLRGRHHRQNYVLRKYNNLAEMVDLSQARLREEAAKFDERRSGGEYIETIYSDEAFPWPSGKAPWLRENGGDGEVPPGALQNFGRFAELGQQGEEGRVAEEKEVKPARDAELPSVEEVREPRSIQEAIKLLELAASLAATAAASPHLPLAAGEQHAVKAGLAVLRVKLGAVEEGGARLAQGLRCLLPLGQ